MAGVSTAQAEFLLPIMETGGSHRNLLWSDHWPVVFHKQTGTLLYSLFVSWLFYYKVTEEWMALQCVFYRMLTLKQRDIKVGFWAERTVNTGRKPSIKVNINFTIR